MKTKPARPTPAVQSADDGASIAEANRKEVCRSIAAGMIERGLQSTSNELHFALIQIADSQILGKDDIMTESSDKLAARGEKLLDRFYHLLPVSRQVCSTTQRMAPRTLLEEINLYRQETYWTVKVEASRQQSETLIRELFAFYRDAEWLMLSIDSIQPAYRIERRVRSPEYRPNPYGDPVDSPTIHESAAMTA